MIQKREIFIDGIPYQVVISDEKETLLAAKAAGRVIVGLLHKDGQQDLSSAKYLIEELDTADDTYLERVVRRQYGLPWNIAETKQLLIREFTLSDLPNIIIDPEDNEEDQIFYRQETLSAYIHSQYAFYEFGVWGIIRKDDGSLIGKAGVTGDGSFLELGYHIFKPYRGQGYATEACQAILSYVKEEWDCPVSAWVGMENKASQHVLKKLGFLFTEQTDTIQEHVRYRYEWNC